MGTKLDTLWNGNLRVFYQTSVQHSIMSPTPDQLLLGSMRSCCQVSDTGSCGPLVAVHCSEGRIEETKASFKYILTDLMASYLSVCTFNNSAGTNCLNKTC